MIFSNHIRTLLGFVLVLGMLAYKYYDNGEREKSTALYRQQPKVGDAYAFKVNDQDNKDLPFRLMKISAMTGGRYKVVEAKWGYPTLDALRDGYGKQANDKDYFSVIPMEFEKKEEFDEFLNQFEVAEVIRP